MKQYMEKYVGNRGDLALIIIRLAVGAVFVAHGISKLNTGMEGVGKFFGSIGIPFSSFFAWIVTAVEIVGGIALLVGFEARFAALLLSVVMVVAIVSTKLKNGLLGKGGAGFELELILLAANLAIFFQGAGRFSLDKKRANNALPPTPKVLS